MLDRLIDRDELDCCEGDVCDVPYSVETCPFECEYKAHLDAAELRMEREAAGQLRLPLDKPLRSRVILPSSNKSTCPTVT